MIARCRTVGLILLCTGVAALLAHGSAQGRDLRSPGPTVLALAAAPTHLAFSGGVLGFCEAGSARIVAGGQVRAEGPPAQCGAPDESDDSCSAIVPEILVRAPPGEADDIVNWDAWSLPMTGRVHACAAAERTAVIATGSRVVLADLDRQRATVLARRGADRVAIGSDAVAWVRGRKIFVMARRP